MITPDLPKIATAYIGHPTNVVCWTRGQFDAAGISGGVDSVVLGQIDWDFETDTPLADAEGRYTIHLTRQICYDLSKPGHNASQWQWDTTSNKDSGYGPQADVRDGMAFATFLHEMTHAKLRSSNESLVECTTYENRWIVIRLFRPMKRWVQKQIYWGMKIDHARTLPNYREVC